MSINDATNVAAAAALSTSSTVKKTVAKTLTNNIFAKTIQHLTRKRYKCYYGKAFDQLPNDEVTELNPEILAHYSGPDNGINDVSLISHRKLLRKQSNVQNAQTVQNSSSTDSSINEIKEVPKLNEGNKKSEIKDSIINGNTDDQLSNEKPKINGNELIKEIENIKKATDKPKIDLKENERINKNKKNKIEIKIEKENAEKSTNGQNSPPNLISSSEKLEQILQQDQQRKIIKKEVESVIKENNLNKEILHENVIETIKNKVENSEIPIKLIDETNNKSDKKELIAEKVDQNKVENKINEKVDKNFKDGKSEPDKSKLDKPEQNLETNRTIPANRNLLLTEQALINDCWDSFNKSKIDRWNVHSSNSYGIAISLYENNQITKTAVGDPIADVFSILTRQNCSIMLLADGVNWGPRSRLAARCAVRAAMNYLNKHIFFPTNDLYELQGIPKKLTTHDVFTIMMKAFDAAQEYILQKKGTMTTLCCSVVLKLKDNNSSSTPLWAVCTLSIGDSTSYVFNKEKGVIELTYGARNINDDRDMRNVGGALGHVYGRKPDVSNLNYSLMYIKEGDIVFLVSDGISDNFDPCVSQTAMRKPEVESLQQETSDEKQQMLQQKITRSHSQSHKHIHRNSLISFASNAFSSNTKKTSGVNDKPKCQRLKNQLSLSADDQNISTSTLPQLSPNERYLCGLAHMNEVLITKFKNVDNSINKIKITAQETCTILIDHVMKVTSLKRNVLEKGLIEAANLEENEKQKFQSCLRERALKLRGKLDHASIVAYDVGIRKSNFLFKC